MKWTDTFVLLSQCGLGALLLDENGIILAVNPTGNKLLHGEGKLKGQVLPPFAHPLLQPMGERVYAKPCFGEYLLRTQEPIVEDLPQGTRMVVFRKADLEACHDQLLGALMQVKESVIICDDEGRIVYLNDAAVRMDNLTNTGVVGRNIEQIYTPQDEEGLLIPKVLKSRKALPDTRQHYVTLHGRDVDVTASCYPLVQNGQVLGACGIMQDWHHVDSLHKKIMDLQEQILRLSHTKKEKRTQVLRARYHFTDIIGNTPVMRELLSRARRVAPSTSSVLIYGETGTGKELIAQSIHNASNRAEGPFLAVNCAAIPENLLEGILFGTEKGSYTGAETRPGLFEQAAGGTLLLDEINSMPLNLQPKLLRVLQEKMARRVGGVQEYPVDVRLLSNMNIAPQKALEEKKLRLDLFYRLGVVDLRVPPLRERKEDIFLLGKYFIMLYNKKMEKNVRMADASVYAAFARYDWPGNVRELQHAIEYAMNLLPDDRNTISLEYLPDYLMQQLREMPLEEREAVLPEAYYQEVRQTAAPVTPPRSNRRTLREVERAAVEQALRQHGGNISAAARQLGMSRQNLQYRIRRDGISIVRQGP